MAVRSYNLEFKREAVKLYYRRGEKLSEVARSLGIPNTTLRGWRDKLGKKIKQETETEKKSKKNKDEIIKDQENEISKLREQVKKLKEDTDILKKSMGLLLQGL